MVEQTPRARAPVRAERQREDHRIGDGAPILKSPCAREHSEQAPAQHAAEAPRSRVRHKDQRGKQRFAPGLPGQNCGHAAEQNAHPLPLVFARYHDRAAYYV